MFTLNRTRPTILRYEPPAGSKLIRSVDEVRDIIHLERARANRSGESFCVVLFQSNQTNDAEEVLNHVLSTLNVRLRETDEMGWASAGKIAAVLPYTQAEEATQFGESICHQVPADLERPAFEVLVYPEDLEREDSAGQSSGRDVVQQTHEAHQETPKQLSMDRLFAQAIPSWKRLADVVLSFTALVLLSPLMVMIAICVKFMSPGPVMFKQLRTGLGGRPFEMHKFRTMKVNAEADQIALRGKSEQDGPAFKMKDDPRITRIGKLLRRTSLDELPQLWNVLKGDMSLVGPRPLPCHETNACDPWQRRRLDVTPGITCIWQTEGRSRVTFDQWMRMDIDYIQTRSIRRDVSLLFRTIWAITSCRGAQ
ncbi:MAG: sugar transferase [Planctomycetota bacterium]